MRQKHANHIPLRCAVGAVYEIPLSCNLRAKMNTEIKEWNGMFMLAKPHNACCTNDHLGEHRLPIQKNTALHLPLHRASCECEVLLKNTRILGRSRESWLEN